MTLAAQITSDVTGVFLDTDDFAETVTHYANGDTAQGTSRTALVELDEESQLAPILDDHGERMRRVGILTLPSSVTVSIGERHSNRDTVLIGSTIWGFTRIHRVEKGMTEYVIERDEPITTKRTRIER